MKLLLTAAMHVSVAMGAGVTPLDVSLETFPVASYGARWGVRGPDMLENMSKMQLVVLMQEDGECW